MSTKTPKTKKEKITATKRALTKKRIEISEAKAKVGKLGEKTEATQPTNYEVLFAGRMCEFTMKNMNRVNNMLERFKEEYSEMPKHVQDALQAQINDYAEYFDANKKDTVKITNLHPLWQRLHFIKGFSSYQLALIMSHVKDIKRFDTASKLAVYAGNAAINGIPICKANLNKIKEYYSSQGKEFNGFSTVLAGRLNVIADCLIRSKGFFYYLYLDIRKHLSEKAINEGRAVEQENKTKVIENKQRDDTKFYMVGKNNQTLDMYTHRGAIRRIIRVLLHIIWHEWRKMENLDARIPYPIEYLGHTGLITTEMIREREATIKGS